MRFVSLIFRPLVLGVLLTAAPSPAGAQTLYWAGLGGTVATAGAGQWDLNTSVDWRDSTPTGALVKWTEGRTAVFQGTSGGAVSMTDSLSVAAVQFGASAGPFVFTSSSTLEFTGAGLSSDSTSDQIFQLSAASLAFRNSASAGAGAQAAHLTFHTDGLTTFADTSTAGHATFTNDGELHFSQQSSAGTATINNGTNGFLVFQDTATSGAAAITNRGQLLLQDDVHDLAGAAFSNLGGSIDLAGVAWPGAVTFGSLTQGANASLTLGTNHLVVASLNLTNDQDLNFDLGASANGMISVTSSILGNTAANGTRITVYDAGGLSAGSSVTLLDWSAASSALGVDPGDFQLQPLPSGFTGILKISDSKLVLEILPEPGSLVLGCAGALGLLARRPRRGPR
jgi:hypothetical protein